MLAKQSFEQCNRARRSTDDECQMVRRFELRAHTMTFVHSWLTPTRLCSGFGLTHCYACAALCTFQTHPHRTCRRSCCVVLCCQRCTSDQGSAAIHLSANVGVYHSEPFSGAKPKTKQSSAAALQTLHMLTSQVSISVFFCVWCLPRHACKTAAAQRILRSCGSTCTLCCDVKEKLETAVPRHTVSDLLEVLGLYDRKQHDWPEGGNVTYKRSVNQPRKPSLFPLTFLTGIET